MFSIVAASLPRILLNACPSTSRSERGVTSAARLPSATAVATPAISARYLTEP